ncbi:hypothetical protein PGTUg99_018561 [Puccinia graminis f. sp. tritici]|uniref:RRM domain-containing protein n=2 Tax=Puccinia graminis f. sp. tritici TaxID=56615 RepID=E3JYS2_PUCGT|nr:uncharacterized protein PGTG_03153 [Puccinia graminis f. sp. tritici CRL 75-36-700-3]EFP77197.2 hypothetical protein PGTG_03153 [Puccinia graminis f. sp. tritici CRL 75-36-700-3]KAA1124253.1 hypothetical protein PGTUg99_018561 [Puccinia graminis f. sp. tritici]
MAYKRHKKAGYANRPGFNRHASFIMSSPPIIYEDEASYCTRYTDTTTRLVKVSNLTLGTSEDDVRAAFQEFGNINHCFILMSAPTAAWLVFATPAEALASIVGMKGAVADGRKLRVHGIPSASLGGLALLLRIS